MVQAQFRAATKILTTMWRDCIVSPCEPRLVFRIDLRRMSYSFVLSCGGVLFRTIPPLAVPVPQDGARHESNALIRMPPMKIVHHSRKDTQTRVIMRVKGLVCPPPFEGCDGWPPVEASRRLAPFVQQVKRLRSFLDRRPDDPKVASVSFRPARRRSSRGRTSPASALRACGRPLRWE